MALDPVTDVMHTLSVEYARVSMCARLRAHHELIDNNFREIKISHQRDSTDIYIVKLHRQKRNQL